MYGALSIRDQDVQNQKMAGSLFAASLVSVAIFVKLFFAPEPEIEDDEEFVYDDNPDGPPEIDQVNKLFKAFRKAGLRFSKAAKKRVVTRIVHDHSGEPITGELILGILGNLAIAGRVRRPGFDAANLDDTDSRARALRRLRKIPGEKFYISETRFNQVFIRVNEDQLAVLNQELAEDGIEFREYIK